MFIQMQKNFTANDFKREWSFWEQRGVLTYLQDAFAEEYRIKDIEHKFGLPYTSSSSFAMISNTNCKFEIEEGWQLEYFTLTENNILIAVAGD